MPGDEDGNDGEQVVGELALGFDSIRVAENHEFRPSLAKDPLEELDAEAREPVAVHNHDALDLSRVHSFQKGREPATLPVEAAADVLDDLPSGVLGEEVKDLAVEVLALVLGADAGVEDGGSGRRRFLGRAAGEELGEIVGVVEVLASRGGEGAHLALGVPPSKACARDIVAGDGAGRGDVGLLSRGADRAFGLTTWKSGTGHSLMNHTSQVQTYGM